MKFKPSLAIVPLALSIISTVISTKVSSDFIKSINDDPLIYVSISAFIGITTLIASYALLNTAKRSNKLISLLAFLIAVSMSIATIYAQIGSDKTIEIEQKTTAKINQINAQIKGLQSLNSIALKDVERLTEGLASTQYKTRDNANIRNYKQEINKRNQEITQQQALLPNEKNAVTTASEINALNLFYASIWDLFSLFMQLSARFLRQTKQTQQSNELSRFKVILNALRSLNKEASITSTNLIRRVNDASTLEQKLARHQLLVSQQYTRFEQQANKVQQEKDYLIDLVEKAKSSKSELVAVNQSAGGQQQHLEELQALLTTTSQRCIDITDASREALTNDQVSMVDQQEKLQSIKKEITIISDASYQHLKDLREAVKSINQVIMSADKKEANLTIQITRSFNEQSIKFNGFNQRFIESNQTMNEFNQSMNQRINEFNQ